MSELPTIELVDAAFYWIKPRYGDKADVWTVARWECNCFWDLNGREVAPRIIQGPIPRPDAALQQNGGEDA